MSLLTTLVTGGWVVALMVGAAWIRPRAHGTEAASRSSPGSGWSGAAAIGAIAAAGVAAVTSPWTGVALLALVAGAAVLQRRRVERGAERLLLEELPEVIDVVRMALSAGLTVRGAALAASRNPSGAVAKAFASAIAAAEVGARFADALEEQVKPLGAPVRPLLAALLASERYGVAASPALERLSAEARADARRRGEAEARKVPVRLLFPLILCILPAFALLTVAPLIAGSLRALRL